MISILLVDNDVPYAAELQRKFTDSSMKVTRASCTEDALSLSKIERFEVALISVRSSESSGIDLLEKLKQLRPKLKVIMSTDHPTVDLVVNCMKRGADDFLIKPYELSNLVITVSNVCRKKPPLHENTLHEKHRMVRQLSDYMIGKSEEIRMVKDLIRLVAPHRTPVLILGETGSGKELVAKAIHDQSPRRETPLVVINAAILQENILGAELFGYKKGAFTGAFAGKKGLLEVAHNGTCFIDEIGDMGLGIQAKILRVIETGVFMKLGDTRETKVDVRFLFATNVDLNSSVECGYFRKDLSYRINAFSINLPPLRERKSDIILLANHFLKKYLKEKKCLSEKVIQIFVDYDWPGNVRELVSVVHRSVLVSGDRKTIIWKDLPENITNTVVLKTSSRGIPSQTTSSLPKRKEEHISKVIDLADDNKTEAARLLGISRNTLYRKLALQ